ncbi:MAG: DUF3098 domain-containing protein [Bacteroidales bacterium]|jgi:hypothetical protein|nr:DUF3098 domain-containing protein [Bacteroidales bacterium]
MNSKEKSSTTKPVSNPTPQSGHSILFEKSNYMLLILGLIFIAIGFIFMTGGGSKDPAVFDQSIFSFRRITLAPIFVLIGYIIEIYAIMKKPVEN